MGALATGRGTDHQAEQCHDDLAHCRADADEARTACGAFEATGCNGLRNTRTLRAREIAVGGPDDDAKSERGYEKARIRIGFDKLTIQTLAGIGAHGQDHCGEANHNTAQSENDPSLPDHALGSDTLAMRKMQVKSVIHGSWLAFWFCSWK